MSNHSSHIPGIAGGIADVTGELIVDTGLRRLKTAVATLGVASTASEAIVDCTVEDVVPGGTYKIKLQVFAADGFTAGAAEVPVHWMALDS